MENNHLTYFKVENFKKFDALEVNDIGQFNLIVGDNNVGKTCLLEALLVDEDPQQLLDNFWLSLKKRGLVFQIEEITKKVGNVSTTETIYPKENYFKKNIIKEKQKESFFYIKDRNKENEIHISISNPISLAIYNLTKDKKDSVISKYGFEINIKENINQFIDIYNKKIKKANNPLWIYDYNEGFINFPLISFNDTPLEIESRSIYENLKTKREKQILIDILKVVNTKIVDVELREKFEDLKSVFLISFEDKDEFVPLNFLGDGFKRIFYIALKALSLKGKRILIDEIEIGIHYSKMKDFWVNIFNVCKELDIQLFATTHSQECIEAYIEASNDVGEKNIRLIRLQENKDKSIKAICYKEEYIEYMVESNTEER
ncbi:putative ATPase [Flavobacterium branchiophilum]|uniref:Predicted ATPase n=1 Tax=Flavobacterium branchiophilum (strain FL-15) TaxID=1034807 RepID=G2Z5Y0_FLABF|nr:ATP-binding protein [Flavobacterium branchiophilum]CCB68740.1 Predicted ATPase [Flavobacterium branchiophilum FL-15]